MLQRSQMSDDRALFAVMPMPTTAQAPATPACHQFMGRSNEPCSYMSLTRLEKLGEISCRVPIAALMVGTFMSANVVGVPREACDPIPQAQVARIIGNAARNPVRNPPVDVGATKVPQCACYLSISGGHTAVITVMNAESAVALRRRS